MSDSVGKELGLFLTICSQYYKLAYFGSLIFLQHIFSCTSQFNYWLLSVVINNNDMGRGVGGSKVMRESFRTCYQLNLEPVIDSCTDMLNTE